MDLMIANLNLVKSNCAANVIPAQAEVAILSAQLESHNKDNGQEVRFLLLLSLNLVINQTTAMMTLHNQR